MTVVLLTFISVFLLSGALIFVLSERHTLRARMASFVRLPSDTPEGLRALLRPSQDSIGKLIDPLQRLLPRSAQETSVVRTRLILAGFRKPFHMDLFYAAKVLSPVTCVLITTITGTYSIGPFFAYAMAVGLGFLLPDFWVGNRISARKVNIQFGLAEALDLMVVCIEAGLGLDQTVQRVARELKNSHPEIAEELDLVVLEQRAGRSRADAWRNLAARTDIESVRALVAMLMQADQFGTSVSTCLRVHSESLRTQRRQKAEEQAAKTTVKLVFPLVFFIFPSLFLVVLGPSMIIMMDAFDKYLLK
ncbi:MAG TPA: type II secretion system F family protein [Bryobacteraceae bacterium]|nr:type II secretion system F family protein [Bryobacteraceae bacterium]